MLLAKVLKQRRTEQGYTLSEIATKMGVSEATVQRWESGNIKTIKHDRIAKLAEILKVPPSAIMGWDEEYSYEPTHNSCKTTIFNIRLKELRKNKGISQQYLANIMGISKSSINMYERGEREPNFLTLLSFANYFNVDINYLLGFSSKPSCEHHLTNIDLFSDTEKCLIHKFRENTHMQAAVLKLLDINQT
ncbi:MAG: helix-turn-helix domain-containing protein [Clostridia bacterium]|nr:helix-turn-helix domain-containing protein [Clostridia bacterium]